jgi:arsenate reductase-like glutaredoxin family protein
LLDEQSRAFRDSGLGYMRLDDAELFARMLGDQRLLRLPLVRAGREVSVGNDESAWKAWLSNS